MDHSDPGLAPLLSIWERAKKDEQAQKAIEVLKQDKLDLETMWRTIAVIPLLPNRRARSRVLPVPRGARRVVRFLREISEMAAKPYSEVQAHDGNGITYFGTGAVRDVLKSGQLAGSLEKALGCRWVLTESNAQQNALASLSWEVKERTGKLHDRQLADVLDAVFRAAGKKFSESHDTIRKSLDHELHVRQAGLRKSSQ